MDPLVFGFCLKERVVHIDWRMLRRMNQYLTKWENSLVWALKDETRPGGEVESLMNQGRTILEAAGVDADAGMLDLT